jgi:hypothetical protein
VDSSSAFCKEYTSETPKRDGKVSRVTKNYKKLQKYGLVNGKLQIALTMIKTNPQQNLAAVANGFQFGSPIQGLQVQEHWARRDCDVGTCNYPQ